MAEDGETLDVGKSDEPKEEKATVPAENEAGAGPLTHFNFRHKVFESPGAKFGLDRHSRKPIFMVTIGELTGSVEIAALQREFNIAPDSHDGKLVDLAVQATRYVPDVRPGDTIPTELIDGSASWSVSERHKLMAQQRLQLALLSWLSGESLLLTDAKEIDTFLNQPENREKLKAAFREATVSLGNPPEKTEPVLAHLELLARELCYIEALRERVGKVRAIGKKLAAIAQSYGNDRLAKQELERVQQLVVKGIAQLNHVITDADNQVREMVASLKSVDKQIQVIRTRRDALYMALTDWKDHLSNFDAWAPVRTPRSDRAVNALYRFLAPRFTSAQSLFKRNSA